MLGSCSTQSRPCFDGDGYPSGLKGENIPIGSRIIVADVYDALTAWRVHREAWESAAALAELQREVDKGAFEPRVVEGLAKLLG